MGFECTVEVVTSWHESELQKQKSPQKKQPSKQLSSSCFDFGWLLTVRTNSGFKIWKQPYMPHIYSLIKAKSIFHIS